MRLHLVDADEAVAHALRETFRSFPEDASDYTKATLFYGADLPPFPRSYFGRFFNTKS